MADLLASADSVAFSLQESATVPSLISVLQFAATFERSEKCTISIQGDPSPRGPWLG